MSLDKLQPNTAEIKLAEKFVGSDRVKCEYITAEEAEGIALSLLNLIDELKCRFGKGWRFKQLVIPPKLSPAQIVLCEHDIARAFAERREMCAKVAKGNREAHSDCNHSTEYFDGREDAAESIRKMEV